MDVFLKTYSEASKTLKALDNAMAYITENPSRLENEISNLKKSFLSLKTDLYGNSSKKEIGEKEKPTISDRLSTAKQGYSVSYGPTKMQMESLDIAKELLNRMTPVLEKLTIDISKTKEKLIQAGAPPILD